MIYTSGDHKLAKGGEELRYNCTECANRGYSPDTKYHLHINRVSGLYHCFRCGYSGKQYGTNFVKEDPIKRWKKAVSKINCTVVSDKGEGKEKLFYDEYTPIEDWMDAYTYLLDRGISEEDIAYYKMGIGKKRYRGRIIIPDFSDEGVPLFWVGRKYSDRAKVEDAKYLNPSNVDREFVFNLDRVSSDYSKIIIAEGVFSAIVAGRNAVATYGKIVSGTQIDKLVKHKFEMYEVAFDGDAYNNAMDLCEMLHRRGCNTSYVVMPEDKDPADLGRDAFLKLPRQNYSTFTALRKKLGM